MLVKWGTRLDGTEWKVPALVIEDRGPLRGGGKQIVRVRFLSDSVPYEESEFPLELLEFDPSPA